MRRRKGAIILCAEDNPLNRQVLTRVLDRLGASYEIVNDGIEALGALDRTRQGLLLTDAHMPQMDGWDLCRKIRRRGERGVGRASFANFGADRGCGQRRRA